MTSSLWKWLLNFNTTYIYEYAFMKPLPFRCALFYGPVSLKRWSRVTATHRTSWLSGSTHKWTELPSLQVYNIKIAFCHSLWFKTDSLYFLFILWVLVRIFLKSWVWLQLWFDSLYTRLYSRVWQQLIWFVGYEAWVMNFI